MTSTEPTPETPPVVPDAPAAGAVIDHEAEARKWKETSLKIEQRANAAAAEAKTLADKLKAYEDRDMTELDKLKRDNEEFRLRAETAERARLRADVALSKGIPPEVVGALVGNTAEELTAHADALLAWRGSATPAAPPAPRPDPSQGAQPASVNADEALWEQYKPHVLNNIRK